MKLSMLLFRVLRFIKTQFPKFDTRHLPTTLVLSTLFVFSCRMTSEATSDVASAPAPVVTAPRFSLQADGVMRAHTETLECGEDTSTTARLLVPIETPVGSTEIELQFSPQQKHLLANVESSKMKIQTDEAPFAVWKRTVCDQSGFQREIPNELRSHLEHWLGKIAPDCQWSEAASSGYRCELSATDAAATENELNDIRRTMVRSWSRQPYIITRRLSMSLSLAQALSTPATVEKSLDSICKNISHSDAMELPLALTSIAWQEKVCRGPNDERVAAAQAGLMKSFMEIEYLRQLFERTSRLGTLSVRIPRDVAPTKDLWINLKPGPDVVAQLVKEVLPNSDSSKACWHPMFGRDATAIKIARELDLIGETSGLECTFDAISPEKLSMEPTAYLADSITSETEFVMTNGQSKMLRLPSGTYTYEVRGHYETLGWEANADDRNSVGEISWADKRPSVVIKAW